MHRRFFFTKPRWIGWGMMLTSCLLIIHPLYVIWRYIIEGDGPPPVMGTTRMAADTAGQLVFAWICVFWAGFIIRDIQCECLEDEDTRGRWRRRFTAAQIVTMIVALLSFLSALSVAVATVMKK